MILPHSLVAALHEIFRERHSVDAAVCAERVRGAIPWRTPSPPSAVVWPESTAEVAALLHACAEHRTPVVSRG